MSFSLLCNCNKRKTSFPFPDFAEAPETQNKAIVTVSSHLVLIQNLAYLRHNGSIEAETVRNHHVDLPLAILLSDALVGGEPRLGGLQSGQTVAGGRADVKKLTRLLRRTQAQNRVTVMRVQKTEAFVSRGFVDNDPNIPHHLSPL